MLTTWHHISGVTRTDHEMHEAFEAHYDSINPPVQLGGIDGQEPVEVSASSVLKSRDPILGRHGLLLSARSGTCTSRGGLPTFIPLRPVSPAPRSSAL